MDDLYMDEHLRCYNRIDDTHEVSQDFLMEPLDQTYLKVGNLQLVLETDMDKWRLMHIICGSQE